MKKQVCVDQSLDAGGAEKVLCTIIRAISPDEFKVHLVIVSQLGAFAHLVPDHVTVHELGINNTRKALFSFVKLMREIRPDTVFSSLARTTILAIMARPFCHGYKLIGRYPTMPSLELKEGRLKGWRSHMIKYLYRMVDIVVAQTDEMAEELCEFMKIPEYKVIPLMNPIDVSHINNSVIDKISPFCGDSINLIASGRICQAKAFDTLIEAMNIVISSNKNVHLYIVGNDSEDMQADLEHRVQELDLVDNIHFEGFIQNPYPYYKYCDLFVLSSRREGLPNVLLECQYFNKVAVATKCVPIVERLIDDGKNGCIVDVDDVKALAGGILRALEIPESTHTKFHNSVQEFIALFR